MRILIILTTVALYSALGAFGCNVPLEHYKTMKCTPVGSRPDGCPERYDCPSITAHDNNKCYFNGKTYDIDQRVPDTEVSPFCSALCYCRSANPTATFRCAHIDCPEFFQRFDYDNCLRQYKRESCCASGKVCGSARDKLATCELEDEIYKEGQRMHFKDNKCRTCICSAGFNRNATDTDPNCYDKICGFELFSEKQLYGGGIPVYKRDVCCPWDWRMPKESDSVVRGSGKTSTDPKLQCKYGDLTLNVGDTLKIQQFSKEFKVTCSCQVPPLIQCEENSE